VILIDDRAGSRDLITHHPLDNGDIATLARLDSGDVCIVGNGPNGRPRTVGVELKSLADLMASANNGRLQATQAARMLDDYDSPWLLYYGEYRCGPRGVLQTRRRDRWETAKIGKREVPWIYIEGLMLTLAATGFSTKHVADVSEAALWIGALHRWWSKDWTEHRGMRTFDRSRELGTVGDYTADTMMRARMIAAIPGIGFERGMAAAEYFKSVPDMMSATVTEWALVPGIGKVLGGAIRAALHRKET